MGMFDYYQPVPDLKCPVCGETLTGWQGKDGPCALFIWQQGFAAPVDQSVDSECRNGEEQMLRARLPAEFYISSATAVARDLQRLSGERATMSGSQQHLSPRRTLNKDHTELAANIRLAMLGFVVQQNNEERNTAVD